ncbi:MAG: CoA-binding protein [Spirochaetota bacterium]
MNNARRGYGGRLYGVGSEEGEVEGVRVYKNVSFLPETPDAAIIITPAETIPAILRECGLKGIPPCRHRIGRVQRILEGSGGAGERDRRHRP